MIVVHFFTRVIRRKAYLMADSSSTEGSSPLWDSAEVVCEIDPGADPDTWLERAKARVMDSRPELKYMRTLKPKRRKGATQVFDMLFEIVKGAGMPAPEGKSR